MKHFEVPYEQVAGYSSLSDILLHVCTVDLVVFGAGHLTEQIEGFHLFGRFYSVWVLTSNRPAKSAVLRGLGACVLLLSPVVRERLTTQPSPDEHDSKRGDVSRERFTILQCGFKPARTTTMSVHGEHSLV